MQESTAEVDREAIADCFNRYKKAVLNDRGEEALKCIDQKTRQYYSENIWLIKKGPKDELKKLTLLDQLSILLMRHKASKAEILPMNGDDLFVYGVKNGMIDKNSTAGLQLGTIAVEGDFAQSKIVVKGREAPFGYDFYRENGEWKIDLTSALSVAASAFQSLPAQQNVTENEFLMTLLENAVGKEPDDSVWEPLER